MLSGQPVGTAKESMPHGAFSDMQRCMHFADEWEEDKEIWDDFFCDVKVESLVDVAHHRRKFAIVEDAFNARWMAALIFGRRLTMDESRTPGWYHGPITQEPEPKPVCTGATMHTVCVMDGPLATYKLHARLHIPVGILQIPVFSVPVALFPQESRFMFRRNLFFTPSEIRSVWVLRSKLRRT